MYIEYLNYMSRFFDIHNHDLWCQGAIKNLERYSMADDRHIYVLKKLNIVIGFALVNKHLRFNSDGFAVAEFYIQKNHEKKGYGRRLAEHVFAEWPGKWEVAVSARNTRALAFWEQVLSSYTDNSFIKKRNASFSGYGFVFNTS